VLQTVQRPIARISHCNSIGKLHCFQSRFTPPICSHYGSGKKITQHPLMSRPSNQTLIKADCFLSDI